MRLEMSMMIPVSRAMQVYRLEMSAGYKHPGDPTYNQSQNFVLTSML